ncbi:HD-GYP domain-containing protein [Bacillus ndiopicus]|uniref:HD-GYP domain-containing protein n=1 Tax=Bacillus ndiopicus TaxID=1347368 RepID=UPI0005A837FB|nr:HD-GYP domain-containing protein [Bacillus ndiopicus]
MRLISLNVVKEGMVIGKTIWNEAGHPLLHQGVVINHRIIERLRQLNIRYIYIDDLISDGIQIEETVDPIVRHRIVKEITKTFETVRTLKGAQASYMIEQQSKAISGIVEGLLDTILSSHEFLTILSDAYLYDEYLYQHSFQVTLYSIAIAKELGYSYEELRLIGIGAILHDIGKLLVPADILKKPGTLTEEEYNEMKLHARYGFDLLRNLHSISLLVAHCAFQHHERLDGSGYPRGLVEFEIHPFAKIIGVADVFDAVTSNRVYRQKALPSEGIAILEKDAGKLYDAKVVDALKKCIVHYPNGTVLTLSDKRRGIVSRQNELQPALPYLRVFEENDEMLLATYEINLASVQNIRIEKIETEFIPSE